MATKTGVARAATNIKSMSGNPSGVIASLPVGGWVRGNLSASGMDLVDITEWFRPNGEQMPLAVPCKASIVNLTVTNYTEPGTDPEPPPVVGENAHIEINITNGVVESVTVNDRIFTEQ